MKNLVKTNSKFLVNNIKAHEILLSLVLIVYIFSGYTLPHSVTPYVNNVFSYVFAIFLTVLVLTKVNLIIGLLFGLSFYLLFHRSGVLNNLESSEESKHSKMTELNTDFSIPLVYPKNKKGEIIEMRDNSNILEVEVVDKMAPSKEIMPLGEGSYNPVQAGGINASTL